MSDNAHDYALLVMQRADTLGAISEEPDRLTRRFGTPAMRKANITVAAWMREAGMAVREDNIGNLIGRYEGSAQSTVVLGSHLDTVRDAGKYDGPLGVLVAIACVQRLHEQERRLPFAIEVVAFADEEGLRFGTSYLGSKVYTGTFDPAYLDVPDADEITLARAILDMCADPSALAHDRRDVGDLLGYCEVHIEQGPVLEAEGLPVGVVSAISSQSRFTISFEGVAGHAGTVPMSMRRDPLVAAAELALAVESLANSTEGLVATVGQLSVEPGASNVIPGHVTLSLDVRHFDDVVREEACRLLQQRAEEICEKRDVSLDWRLLQTNPSVPCASPLARKLARAVEAAGYSVRFLPSGAGHDAVTMAAVCPVAMLFVRCKGGISHNPAESVTEEDVGVAIDVLGRFLDLLGEELNGRQA